jgi:hypothetical protein
MSTINDQSQLTILKELTVRFSNQFSFRIMIILEKFHFFLIPQELQAFNQYHILKFFSFQKTASLKSLNNLKMHKYSEVSFFTILEKNSENSK